MQRIAKPHRDGRPDRQPGARITGAAALLPETNRRLFLACAAVFLCACLYHLWHIDPADPHGLRVFGSYWASGEAAWTGGNPYAVHERTWVFGLGGLTVVDVNLNPPTLLPLFQLFALFEPGAGARLWLLVSAVLMLLSLARVFSLAGPGLQKAQVVWPFLTPAVYDTLILGQVYALLLGASALAWSAMRQVRHGRAGLWIGLAVAIKPSFVLWPLFLLLTGRRRTAGGAFVVVAAAVSASAAVYGPGTYMQWIAALVADEHALLPTDASLQGWLARLGRPGAGAVAAGFLVFAACWLVALRRPPAAEAGAIAIAVAILASPLAWMHYTLLLYPALLGRPWNGLLLAAAGLLTIPVGVPLRALNGAGPEAALLGGIYMAAVLLVLAAFAARALGTPVPGAGTSRRREPAATHRA